MGIRIAAEINSDADDESFAIDDLAIGPYIRTWPALDTFETGIDGWISNKVPLLRSECGTLGSILGGYNVAAGGNFLRKVYQHLPEHTGIHVMLDAIAIDSWDAERFIVEVDGTVVWAVTRTGDERGAQHCGAANSGWYETRYRIDVTLPHTKSDVTINVLTTLNGPGNDESFGIDNVHIGPPASETWPTVDNFDGGSTQGWSGYPANELVTTNCGDYGTILGGYAKTAQYAYFEKTFDALPPHRGLVIQMTVYYIDSWDGESVIIDVDGIAKWSQQPPDQAADNKCGGGGIDRVRFAYIEIPQHYSSHVQIRVRNTLDQDASDESMAIDDVRVMPLV